MKKTLVIYVAALCCAGVWAGESPDLIGTASVGLTDMATTGTTDVSVSASGGTVSATLTIDQRGMYHFGGSNKPSWIKGVTTLVKTGGDTIQDSSGDVNIGVAAGATVTVTFKVDANKTSSPRTWTYAVSGDSGTYRVIVTQASSKGGKDPDPVLPVEGFGSKKLTYQAVVVDDDMPVAVVEVKAAKANRKGQVAVTGSVTPLNGNKKATFRGTVSVTDPVFSTSLKEYGDLEFFFDGEEASGTLDGLSVVPAVIGGALEDGALGCAVGMDDLVELADAGYLTFVQASDDPEAPAISCLPLGTPMSVVNGKLKLPKAGKITYVAKTNTIELSNDNPSGLKLSYTPKTGVFKGSFNLYSLKTGKLKKTSAKITGYVIDGIGYCVITAKGVEAIPFLIQRSDS